MAKSKKPEILTEVDFDEEVDDNIDVESIRSVREADDDDEEERTLPSWFNSELLIKTLAIIGALFILFFTIRFFVNRNNEVDSGSGQTSSEAEEDSSSDTDDQKLSTSGAEEKHIVFTENDDDTYSITGRVSKVVSNADRSFVKNIIIENEYELQLNDQAQSVAKDLNPGNWVEVRAQGRKSFSTSASYILNLDASNLYIKSIESPVGDEVEDDTAVKDVEDESVLSDGNNDARIKKAQVRGNIMKLELSYLGCGDHDFNLDVEDISQEDDEREITLQLKHKASTPCDTQNDEEHEFDISEHIKPFDDKIPYTIKLRGTENNNLEFEIS